VIYFILCLLFTCLYSDIETNLDQLQGASKIIGRFLYKQPYVVSHKFQGGISRGNALGNVYNWDDIRMADPPALVQRGSIFLYFSNKNPSEIIPTEMHPTMKTSVVVFNSTKPLFEALAKKYPDVTNKGKW
jgi:hypothetical protein